MCDARQTNQKPRKPLNRSVPCVECATIRHACIILPFHAYNGAQCFEDNPLLMPGSFGLALPRALRSFTETLGSTRASFFSFFFFFELQELVVFKSNIRVYSYRLKHTRRCIPSYVNTEAMLLLPLSTWSCRGIFLHLSKIAQNSENTQTVTRHSLISKIMRTKSARLLDLDGDCWLFFVLVLRTARHVRCNEGVKFQIT